MIDPELEQWLENRPNMEKDNPSGLSRRASRPTLERMKLLCKYLGDPQLGIDAIHITGTNGKTSTCRITESLMSIKGFSTGLLSSPHLGKLNERVSINSEPISDFELENSLNVIKKLESEIDVISADSPSYFEIMVAAGFYEMDSQASDVGIIEVGMGGLYDATNICESKVSVITNVGLDHMAYLGDNVHDIALEKSGIIKENTTVVIGEKDEELVSLLKSIALEKNCRIYVVDEDFKLLKNDQAVGGRLLTMQTPYGYYEDVFLPLLGFHQGENALLALVACESFVDDCFGDEIIREGFDKATSPGRMEIISRQPLIMLDGAHNVPGAQALASALSEEFVAPRRIFVIGLTKEKDANAMIDSLGIEDEDIIIACAADSEKAMEPGEIVEIGKSMGLENISMKNSPIEAIEFAQSIAFDDDHIIVTGSLYVVGEIRDFILS
ncbi:MAG: bifunctional folylpolyglutamate synthase/dihydrofolate synthase [Acidimicrobiia bacterium]|nr:bifunctional folylpolyglutamate synthase/dihydrofolate synthase [Acidimicrobiia bacterium]